MNACMYIAIILIDRIDFKNMVSFPTCILFITMYIYIFKPWWINNKFICIYFLFRGLVCIDLQIMEDPRLAGGNYTSKEERISILAKYDKVIIAYFTFQTKHSLAN